MDGIMHHLGCVRHPSVKKSARTKIHENKTKLLGYGGLLNILKSSNFLVHTGYPFSRNHDSVNTACISNSSYF